MNRQTSSKKRAMRVHKRILAAAAALALLFAGWWFGSPWWTLWRMREAAATGDAVTLASYIDFPAVRASMKAQRLPGLAVDALVNPAALRLALLKRRERPDGAGLELIRTGAGEFRLRREGASGGRGDLVFRRHGLGWKLSEVRLTR